MESSPIFSGDEYNSSNQNLWKSHVGLVFNDNMDLQIRKLDEYIVFQFKSLWRIRQIDLFNILPLYQTCGAGYILDEKKY